MQAVASIEVPMNVCRKGRDYMKREVVDVMCSRCCPNWWADMRWLVGKLKIFFEKFTLIGKSLNPGPSRSPLANMLFKSTYFSLSSIISPSILTVRSTMFEAFGYVTMAQALSFAADMKVTSQMTSSLFKTEA